jgi:hypothetical protein
MKKGAYDDWLPKVSAGQNGWLLPIKSTISERTA